MNPVPLAFLALNAVALLIVRRSWAPLPFVLTACYLTANHFVDLGPFTFTGIRILVFVGVVRVLVRRERLAGGLNALDWAIVLWALWMMISGVFHEPPLETLLFRLGVAYSTLGIYFLLRIFCSSVEDVLRLCRATAILLIPVAVEMMYEMKGSSSLFYSLTGAELPLHIREERIRAYGPFAHPILAGTVGSVCLPLMAAAWTRYRVVACAGMLACAAMVVSSASSGPVFSAAAALGALLMWPLRDHMRAVRWLAVLLLIALDLAMKAPVYHLIARIDVVGGSTGYHRFLLIDSAITYFDEWWLAGTEYTRHWAPSHGFSANHTDLTNHYVGMAVVGGLPLLLLFVAALALAFSMVGKRLREQTSRPHEFALWALGCALFAHASTFVAISYFDQSFVFLYLTLAAIGSLRAEAAAPVAARAAAAMAPISTRAAAPGIAIPAAVAPPPGAAGGWWSHRGGREYRHRRDVAPFGAGVSHQVRLRRRRHAAALARVLGTGRSDRR